MDEEISNNDLIKFHELYLKALKIPKSFWNKEVESTIESDVKFFKLINELRGK